MNAKNQKQQWVNDVLIKNEHNVLLEMKKLLSKNNVALKWFFKYVLSKYIFEEDDILNQKEYIDQIYLYHPQILELYNYFRENYYIFEKYNLVKELKIIQFMMHMSKIFDEEKYINVAIKETMNENLKCWQYSFSEDVQYSLKDWIIENRTDLINAKNNCEYNCKEYCNYCTNNEVALEIMRREIYWLIHKFDKLTLSNTEKEFDFSKEKNKLLIFEAYTNLNNREMPMKRKKSKKNLKKCY